MKPHTGRRTTADANLIARAKKRGSQIARDLAMASQAPIDFLQHDDPRVHASLPTMNDTVQCVCGWSAGPHKTVLLRSLSWAGHLNTVEKSPTK